MKNKKPKENRKKEYLEQEDIFDNDYMEEVMGKYAPLIGEFIIRFSELEHELNQMIAKSFIDDMDSVGYRVIKFLNFSAKVELFLETSLERAIYTNSNIIQKLNIIQKNLDEIRIFRNQIVHANWLTLTKKGFVRTRIESDKGDGSIQFVKVKILPKTIQTFINKINSTINQIWKC